MDLADAPCDAAPPYSQDDHLDVRNSYDYGHCDEHNYGRLWRGYLSHRGCCGWCSYAYFWLSDDFECTKLRTTWSSVSSKFPTDFKVINVVVLLHPKNIQFV